MDPTKQYLPVQNHFGPTEGQGVSFFNQVKSSFSLSFDLFHNNKFFFFCIRFRVFILRNFYQPGKFFFASRAGGNSKLFCLYQSTYSYEINHASKCSGLFNNYFCKSVFQIINAVSKFNHLLTMNISKFLSADHKSLIQLLLVKYISSQNRAQKTGK